MSLYIIMGHATHYSKPLEQRHIIRILLMIPIYSLVAWLSIYFHKQAVYYGVMGDCYEAFTISAFFALMCHYLAPDLHSQKNYFRGIKPKQWVWPLNWAQKCCGGENGIWRVPRSGLTWFNVIWVGVFQYCVLRVLMTIVAVVTQHFDLYCESSLSPAFSHIWVLVVESAAVTIAMYCLIQFYIQIKDDIKQHRPFLKILSIKLVIFLCFWQSTVISFLYSSGLIKDSEKIQAPDWKVGLSNLLITIEMAIFSVLHLWAFAWKEYSIDHVHDDEVTDFYGNGKITYQGGPWGMKALLDALNPLDLLKAIGRSFRWLFVGRKKRTLDPSYQVPSEQIGLSQAGNVPTTVVTAYEGAGPFMAGGKGNSPPGEEGEDLLSHAQPNPTLNRLSSGLSPSPYEDPRNSRFYSTSQDRLSDSSMLDPMAPTHQPFSPYEHDSFNNPYMIPSDSELDTHRHYRQPSSNSSGQESGVTTRLYHPNDTQHDPIRMPDPYQPLPHDDYERGRSRY
ncbi:OSTA/TMEM184 family protein [Aspergillus ruber CBS 135680]|uniref:Putative DUF300 domain protein n=1 Tax=Aspergillus ruber (strain CBS 135680) TaxID=1388766 RepID=A0A017S980_ASPRC|nr:putative DUF300 domain protein [Aspergillus ruber CBS 135680]EYE93573.1 putative DUF300 domain protein [Aspergillus ruber CBS 135680]